MKKTHTIISDPGIDDMIALLLLYKLSPCEPHLLISTFGNVPEKHTSQNAQEFIAFVAQHWQYIPGMQKPLKPLECPWPTYFHGPDGVWQVHPDDVDLKSVKKVSLDQQTDCDSLISLGPMTDVAHLLEKKQKIERVTVMGGAFNAPGNETPYAETNIRFDPEAAAHFFASCQNINVSVVPLDVTRQVFWTKDQVLQISEDSPDKLWAKKLLLAWFKNWLESKF